MGPDPYEDDDFMRRDFERSIYERTDREDRLQGQLGTMDPPTYVEGLTPQGEARAVAEIAVSFWLTQSHDAYKESYPGTDFDTDPEWRRLFVMAEVYSQSLLEDLTAIIHERYTKR